MNDTKLKWSHALSVATALGWALVAATSSQAQTPDSTQSPSLERKEFPAWAVSQR
jgi:hypothetical protein